LAEARVGLAVRVLVLLGTTWRVGPEPAAPIGEGGLSARCGQVEGPEGGGAGWALTNDARGRARLPRP